MRVVEIETGWACASDDKCGIAKTTIVTPHFRLAADGPFDIEAVPGLAILPVRALPQMNFLMALFASMNASLSITRIERSI